jgi:hypothetical protein
MKTQIDTIIKNLEKKEKIISYLKTIYRLEIGEEPTIPQAYLDKNLTEDNENETEREKKTENEIESLKHEKNTNSSINNNIKKEISYQTFEEKFESLKFPSLQDKKIKDKILKIRKEISIIEKNYNNNNKNQKTTEENYNKLNYDNNNSSNNTIDNQFNNPYKHYLDLDLSNYGEKGFSFDIFKTIVNTLKLFKSLNSIDLSRNNIDDSYRDLLIEIISFPSIKKINLSYNLLTKNSMKKIIIALRANTNFEFLDFRYNPFSLDEYTCNNLCSTLKDNEVIEFFGISDSTKDSAAIRLLSFKNKNIKTLLLDDSKYKPKNFELLKRSLIQKTCKLEILSMKFNTINITSAYFIEKSLKFNKSLLYLNLSSCGISDLSSSLIISAMDFNKNLTELDLSANKISNLFCHRFSEVLKINKTLVKVNLTKNYFMYDAHFQKIVESLVENQSILCLGNLEETKISIKLRESVEFILNLNKECNEKENQKIKKGKEENINTNINNNTNTKNNNSNININSNNNLIGNSYALNFEDTQRKKLDFLRTTIDFEIFRSDYDMKKLNEIKKGNVINNINNNYNNDVYEKDKSIDFGIKFNDNDINDKSLNENKNEFGFIGFGEEYDDLINKYNIEFGIDEYQEFNFNNNINDN